MHTRLCLGQCDVAAAKGHGMKSPREPRADFGACLNDFMAELLFFASVIIVPLAIASEAVSAQGKEGRKV